MENTLDAGHEAGHHEQPTATTPPQRRGIRRVGWVVARIALGVLALIVVLVLVAVVAPPLTRSYTDRWGATATEVELALPGDEYVADPTAVSTRAVAVNASPQLVYKLLLQMGYKRGGWYGWDWFYKATGSADFVTGSHAETLVPALQRLQIGDVMAINQAVGYRVEELSMPNEAKPGWMLLEGAAGPGTELGNDVVGPKTTNMSWLWFVYPAKDGTTRLILRTKNGGASQGAFADWLYANPLDLGGAIFAHKTLVGIKHTAEELAAQGVK